MSAYMRNMFAYFGLPTPKRRALSRQFFSGDKKTEEIDWAFVFECFAAEERELQYAALDYIERHAKQLTKEDLPKLQRLIETKSWWDTVDCLDAIIGNMALADKSINAVLLDWSKHDNFWLRRIAIDHQLGRKDKTDTGLLAEIITNNFGQEEFFVNKAIGWALREYSKTNPDWVRAFIAENRERMSALSIKEASKYI